MKRGFFIPLAICCMLPLCSKAQIDTLKLDYNGARVALLRNNLSALASYYDVGIAEADLLQSKLWNNLYLIWNQDMYSAEKNQYFNQTLQRLIQVNAIFSVAGKYTQTVKLAKVNVEINKLMLQDVLRCLIYDLGIKYANLSAMQKKEKLYIEVLSRSKALLTNAELKLNLGAISEKELSRLRSEFVSVQSESISNRNDILDEMADLKNLLNISKDVYIDLEPYEPDMSSTILSPEKMISDALELRTDYLISKMQIRYQEQDLKVQKALSMTDVMLGYQPNDKGSNYTRPYQGLVLEMFVPIFNRNQGKIKGAKIKIDQAKTRTENAELRLRNEVYQNYETLANVKRGFDVFSSSFLNSIEGLNKSSISNYEKKNINLLEYIDLQRIYIQNQIQYIELQNEYHNAINSLNFSIGKQIIE